MLKQVICQGCNGSGVVVLHTKALFGLMNKDVPSSCTECGGKGSSWELEQCPICEGQGLVGNESEICRACNGTGHADTFAFVPRELLQAGLEFQRRCEKCGNPHFKLTTGLIQHKVVKSWDALEELRQVEFQDACEVACTSCGHKYMIPVDPKWHRQLDEEIYRVLEDRGIDLSFMYQMRT
jgi:hypothetical protein